jgi:hypothetical protein
MEEKALKYSKQPVKMDKLPEFHYFLSSNSNRKKHHFFFLVRMQEWGISECIHNNCSREIYFNR